MVTKDNVMAALRECYDPCCRDRGISVVDMGLIEDIRIDGHDVHIDILLTTGWCPFIANLFNMMEERVKQLESVENVKIQVIWNTVWTMDRLSDSAREKLTLPMEQLLPVREKRLLAQKKGG